MEIVVLYIFNRNNQIFEPNTELVEETFRTFNKRVIGEPQVDEHLNKKDNVTLSGNIEYNRNTRSCAIASPQFR